MKTVRRRLRLFTRKDLFELFVCIALAGLFVLLSSGTAFGQGNVGINNPTPHSKSLLDLTSSDKGLLTPRMTAAQRTAMFPAPDATGKGMLVYQTDGTQGFYYYDGAAWVMVQSGNAGWGLLGNAGTNPTTNFIGTTDNQGLAFRANNTEYMRIAPNGNVGIGYDSPNFKLDVLGTMPNANMAAIRNLDATGSSTLSMFNHSASAQAYFGMYNPTGIGYAGTATAHPFSINTSNAERMRITAAGNVGIGTTAPARLLEVASGTQAVQRISSANAVNGSVIELLNATAGNNLLGAVNFLDGVTTRGQLGYHLTDGMTFRTGPAERMRIDLNGNVGIGHTSPAYNLDIQAATQAVTRLTSQNHANGSVLVLNNTTTGNNTLGAVNFGDGGTTWGQLGYHLVNGMTFRTANGERMRIDVNGNVGIGTQTPGSKVHVFKASSGLTPNANAISTLESSGHMYQHFLTNTGESGLLFGSAGNANTGAFLHNTTFMPGGFEMRLNGNVRRMSMSNNGHATFGDDTHWPAMRLGAVNDGTFGAVGSLNTNTSGWGGYTASRSDFGGGAHLGFGNAGHATLSNVGFTGTSSNHPFTFITNNTERMRIDASGNVGIGTSAPARLLEVASATQGVQLIRSGNSTNGSVLELLNTTAGNNALGAINFNTSGGTAGQIMYHLTNGMTMVSGNAERMRITPAGNVGIGTATPASELEVNGYTKLGSDAPAIKTKKLTGTTPASQGAFVDVPHGVTGSKILSVQVLIEYTAGNWIPQSYTHSAGYSANFLINATNIRVYTETGNSGNILSRPMKLLITYEA